MSYLRNAVGLSGFALAGLYLVPLSLAQTQDPPASEKKSVRLTPGVEIVVTPNRSETELDTVGSSISVITSEEIEQRKLPNAVELLKTIPSVIVVQSGGPGKTATVFIRGSNSNHTLVLIDNIRVNDSTNGLFDFSDLPAESIERIEIVRGPQSVLYGSEAIGGVIHIITKRGEKGVNANAKIEGGSYGTHREFANVSGGTDQIDANLSASYLDSDGISVASGGNGNSEGDSYEAVRTSNRIGANFLEDGRADATLRFTKGRTELDTFEFGIGAIDALNYRQNRETLQSALVLSKPLLDELITPRTELGYTQDDFRGHDNDNSFNNYDVESSVVSLSQLADIAVDNIGKLTLGYTYEKRSGENAGNFDQERNVNSFFGEQQLALAEDLSITLGIRHDNDSTFGGETTYRGTLAYSEPVSEIRFHSSLGTGFRAPTLNDLYFPNFSNPNLDAETSVGWDAGVSRDFFAGMLSADVTFFRNNYDDLIAFNTETFIPENIQAANAYGIENSLELAPCDALSGRISYVYTESENETTGAILARRPRHQGSFSLTLTPLERLSSTVSFLLINSRRESDGEKMDNYETLNLTTQYQVTEEVIPYIRVENLFDEDYEELPGYGTPGFSVFAGVELSL